MDEQNESKTAEEKLDQVINSAIDDEDYGVDIQTVNDLLHFINKLKNYREG